MPNPKLSVRPPEGEPFVRDVDKDVFAIGRSTTNDLVLRDRWQAKRHVEIRRVGGAYVLRDLGCRCPKYVNGVAIGESAALRNGDVISLGDHELTFWMPDG